MRIQFFALATLVLLVFSLTHCGAPKEAETGEAETMEPALDLSTYPESFVDVMKAHGGLAAWKANRQLSYAFQKGDRKEMQFVDLYDRREYISQPVRDSETETVEMGFDGTRTWVVADSTYKGDPVFYRNLMFYFYAMPWVLADPGINYSEAPPLVFNDVTYPGIMVGYDDGVGFSPKDNYRLHFDPESKKMRWLGYTVTGRSGEKSDRFSWIEYPTWSDYNGVELPDSLVWYVTEENLPVKPRNSRVFSDVHLSEKETPAERFAPPVNARIVDGE